MHSINGIFQLVEYNMRNIFIEKSYTKFDRKTIHRPFSKKSELSISLGQYSKVLYSLSLFYNKVSATEIY